MKAAYIGKDQSYQNESAIYWFRLRGFDVGTNMELDGLYGVCERSGECKILDCDGCPITWGDREEIVARRHCIVTDEMRAN